MKTHLMVKRNWLVSLFTRYNYYMACNRKRKFRNIPSTIFNEDSILYETKGNDKYFYGENKDNVTYGGIDCKNCISTKIYQGESK